MENEITGFHAAQRFIEPQNHQRFVSTPNTRTTAVFIVKYLKTFGFHINNDAFAEHSWYFRNALVRANYNDLTRGIHATTEYLEHFFGNLLLGTEYELKNRNLVIDDGFL